MPLQASHSAASPAFGYLAGKYAGRQLPLSVQRSAAGYFIGTCDPQEGPCSRESQEYFETQGLAQAALDSGAWTQKQTP